MEHAEHWALGTVDTKEKFNAKRPLLAQHEWDRMKATDSRECRNCHNYEAMDLTERGRRAVARHSAGLEEGQSSIDWHKCIAHRLPPIDQRIGAPRLATAPFS